jgi:6-phosphofructokinase 1
MRDKVTTIGVLTSGGDAPGMNAAIRAVVRSAINQGLRVFGIHRGYQGLIEGEISELCTEDVGGILNRGGTFLKSARSEAFRTSEGRQQAFEHVQSVGMDALVVIGGDGTFAGARIFSEEHGIKIIGIPGTIDNDLYGTDWTIGFDTAVNTALDAMDKIKDTADAHDRLFIVEVMGRDAGFIALRSGICAGAEGILIPESTSDHDHLLSELIELFKKGRRSALIVVAEGDQSGGALQFSNTVKQQFPHLDIRVAVLGHIQRGGKPSAMDRWLASQLGVRAVERLIQGYSGEMVGYLKGTWGQVSLDDAIKHHHAPHPGLLKLNELLAR